MSKHHLQLKPHNVTKDFWWYEDVPGISICFGDQISGVINRKIRWSSLRAALKRKDKKNGKKNPRVN